MAGPAPSFKKVRRFMVNPFCRVVSIIQAAEAALLRQRSGARTTIS
jgi:hypothetical protein